MTDISLQQIEIFLTVAEQLNLSEAAKDLFINQSSVSKWIQRLEGSLRTKLFVRNNRGVGLTPDGEFLYTELKPLYSGLSSTLQSIRSLYDMPENIVRIGCINADEIIETLKGFVEAFETDHPDVLFKIVPSNFKDLRENLLLGGIDCAITYYLGFGEYQSLESKKIKKLDSYFALSSRHPLAAYEKLPAERLEGENLYLLTLAEMRSPEERALDLCRVNGFTPGEIRYLPSFLALEMAVKDMRGISINGLNFGRRFKNEIKLFKVENVITEQYLIIAWHKGRCAVTVKQFIDSVTKISGE